jgi:hypothetical protein
VSREDGAWVGERAVLLDSRASHRGEESREAARRVSREPVRERGLTKTLLKRARRGRDLERERRGELASLELDVERVGELLEELESAAQPGDGPTERECDRGRLGAAVEKESDE